MLNATDVNSRADFLHLLTFEFGEKSLYIKEPPQDLPVANFFSY